MTWLTVLLPLPAAEPAVGEWRRRFDWSAEQCVPAHVTVVSGEVGEPDPRAFEPVLSGWRPFEIVLPDLHREDGGLYLAAEPHAELERLSRALAAAHPGLEPYRGHFHLTVARGGAHDDAARSIEPHLPVRDTACTAAVFERHVDGPIRELAAFDLGQGHGDAS